MLTLVLSLVFALYIAGPDLLLRVSLSLFAPPRVRTRPRGEQLAISLILAVGPFLIAAWLVRHLFLRSYFPASDGALIEFLIGVFSSKQFDASPYQFLGTLPFIFRLNLWMLGTIYVIVIGIALVLGYLIRNFGRLSRKWTGLPIEGAPTNAGVRMKLHSLRANALSSVVKPWATPWHLRLSNMLIPDKASVIQVDVLTKMDVLYRGILLEHQLSGDGSLVNITLQQARKFRRDDFVEHRSKAENPDPTRYWTSIHGEVFVILAAEIATINLQYVPRVMKVRASSTLIEKIEAARTLLKKIQAEAKE